MSEYTKRTLIISIAATCAFLGMITGITISHWAPPNQPGDIISKNCHSSDGSQNQPFCLELAKKLGTVKEAP